MKGRRIITMRIMIRSRISRKAKRMESMRGSSRRRKMSNMVRRTITRTTITTRRRISSNSRRIRVLFLNSYII